MAELDAAVVNAIAPHLENSDALEAAIHRAVEILSRDDSAPRRKFLEEHVSELEEQIGRLTEAIALGTGAAATALVSAIQQREGELSKYRAELRALGHRTAVPPQQVEAAIRRLLTDTVALLTSTTSEAQRVLKSLLRDRVTLDAPGNPEPPERESDKSAAGALFGSEEAAEPGLRGEIDLAPILAPMFPQNVASPLGNTQLFSARGRVLRRAA